MGDKQQEGSNFFRVDGEKDLLYSFLNQERLNNPDGEDKQEDPYADSGK